MFIPTYFSNLFQFNWFTYPKKRIIDIGNEKKIVDIAKRIMNNSKFVILFEVIMNAIIKNPNSRI